MAKKRSGQASNRRRSAGRSLPGWVWGLSGLVIGLFVALLVHLHGRTPEDGPPPLSSLFTPPDPPPATQPAEGQGNAPDGTATRPRFEFYRLLPEQEVEVPQQTGDAEPTPSPVLAEEPPTGETATAGDTAGAGDERYLLQAGSFRSAEDADRMKASLALLGIEATIQPVELTGGERWHRVRIGPYGDQAAINEIRRRLQSNDIETILLKADG